MEHSHKILDDPSCVDIYEVDDDNCMICIGYVDGSVHLMRQSLNESDTKLSIAWQKQHKNSVRKAKFASLGVSKEQRNSIFTITGNKALTQFDVETGRKLRCIKKCHESSPYCLCTEVGHKGILSTADEDGCVRSWDWRSDSPMVWESQDCEEYITSLHCTQDGSTLLATGGDATLMAYDWRQRKLIVKSETMQSELLDSCQACASDVTICSGGQGFLEVFKTKEYGNIIERIETKHEGETVDSIVRLRDNVIVTSSSMQDQIRLVHIRPNKDAGILGYIDGGICDMATDSATVYPSFLVAISDTNRLKLWNIDEKMNQVIDAFENSKDLPSRTNSAKDKRRKLKESLQIDQNELKKKRKKVVNDASFFDDIL